MEKSTQKAIIFTGIAIVLFYWCVENFSILRNGIQYVFGLIYPFVLGGAIAFIINVPMRNIEKHLFQRKKTRKFAKFRRPLAFVLTLLAVIMVATVLVLVVVPEITKAFSDLFERVPKAYAVLVKEIERLIQEYPEIGEQIATIKIDWDSLMDSAIGFFTEGTKGLINSGIGVISGVVCGVTTTFISIVFAIYILFQKETLGHQFKKVLYALCKKSRAEKVLEITDLAATTFASFLSGQCLEAVILGSMFVLVMSLFKLPYAWLMGTIIAVTALIPMVGAFIGCFIGIFLILIVDPMQALIFAIMFLVLQQIEGNLIYPHVVGKSVGLPGMWVLVAVTVGGNLGGVIGMVLAIPLFSVVYVLLRKFVNRRLEERKIKI